MKKIVLNELKKVLSEKELKNVLGGCGGCILICGDGSQHSVAHCSDSWPCVPQTMGGVYDCVGGVECFN